MAYNCCEVNGQSDNPSSVGRILLAPPS